VVAGGLSQRAGLGETGVMQSRGTSPRFVGRAAELAQLDELLVEARAGQPVTVLVSGEAGAGKSRLVAEVVAAANERGTRALVGSCMVVGGTSLAFAPFAEALRPLAQELAIGGGGGGTRISPRLDRLVAAPGGAAERDRPGSEPLGAHAQLGLFEDVLGALERAAAHDEMLVVIEDLHWADASSRGLFDFLSRNLRGTPMALVGTARTDEPDDAGFLAWLAEIQRGPRVTRIELEPFGRDDLTELVAGVLGRPPSAALAGDVYERSGGNAFLAEELVTAGERGIQVPGSVRNVVLARMAGLTASARGVLRLAGVAGDRMGHGLLAAAGGLNDDDLLAALRELAESHLLVADRPVEGYAFRHALTREAVYDDLLPGERQQLHRMLARALTDQPALATPPGWTAAEAVAGHWFAAGELEPALSASIAAGNAAREVPAVGAALGHYERALDLWERVADPEAVAGTGRPELLERAAEAASCAGEHERAIRYVDAALDELEHTAATPMQKALLFASKGEYAYRVGHVAEWSDWTGRAMALVRSESPTPEYVGIPADHALALVSVRRYEDATRTAAAALDAARRLGTRKKETIARATLGVCLVMASPDPDAGLRELERGLAVGRDIGDADDVACTYGCLSGVLMTLGRLDAAIARAREAAEVAVQMGVPPGGMGASPFNEAEALFLAGRWDECEHALGRLRDQRIGGNAESWGLALAALLQAVRGQGDAAAGAVSSATGGIIGQAHTSGMHSATQAQLSLNDGNLEAGHREALEGLDLLAGSKTETEVVVVVALTDLGLRIEADRAQVARARSDPGEERAAVTSAHSIAARTLDLRVGAAAVAFRPDVTRAHRALCEAEIGRAEGRSDPDRWRRAAEAGATHEGPYRAAYARFREAEAVLALRHDRARAVEALRAAYAGAEQLGAEPLGRDIEALARRARISLADRQSPDKPPPSPDSGPISHGLTPRELEVLGLLAAGYTNPQIGEALYISRKTASHHVSSVLAKLGVATRVEAAGVAHRLGLTPDSTPI
jgi:DNA-binding CsgD family transcriptional regulator